MLIKVMQVLNNAEILNPFNPELELKDTKSTVKNNLLDLLFEFRGFKFVKTLVLEFKKIGSNDEAKCSIFYSNSKVEPSINESDIDDVFESVYIMIISNIQKSLGKGLV